VYLFKTFPTLSRYASELTPKEGPESSLLSVDIPDNALERVSVTRLYISPELLKRTSS